MAGTTSARRRPVGGSETSIVGRLLPFLLLGVGIALIVLSLLTQYGGTTLLSQSVDAVRSGDGTVYTTRPVSVGAGMYDLSLRITRVRSILDLGFIPFEVTSPDRPGWQVTGRLKTRERRSSGATRRRYASGSRPIEIPEDGEYRFRIAFKAGLDRDLSVTIRSVRADYRVPLWIGLILTAAGLASSPDLRRRAGILLDRVTRS